MHARSTTFYARPGTVDAGIAFVREEVEPAVMELDGCTGLSLLVDRDSGRCIATTGWESEQAMHDSEQRIASLRARGQEIFGSTPEVREWEIAVLHRVRPTDTGAMARLVWIQADPTRVEDNLEMVRSVVLPRVEAFEGFCGMSLLIDRATGTAVTATTFRGRDELAASRDTAAEMRRTVLPRMAAEELETVEMDVEVAHLRVPETV